MVTSNFFAPISNAEIVYNKNNGNLFYNSNGNSSGFSFGGLFAVVEGSPDNLGASDFFVFDV